MKDSDGKMQLNMSITAYIWWTYRKLEFFVPHIMIYISDF